MIIESSTGPSGKLILYWEESIPTITIQVCKLNWNAQLIASLNKEGTVEISRKVPLKLEQYHPGTSEKI